MFNHQIDPSAQGASCGLCGQPATHKIGEDKLAIPPRREGEQLSAYMTRTNQRHNFTAYVCCGCFGRLFGPDAIAWCASGNNNGLPLETGRQDGSVVVAAEPSAPQSPKRKPRKPVGASLELTAALNALLPPEYGTGPLTPEQVKQLEKRPDAWHVGLPEPVPLCAVVAVEMPFKTFVLPVGTPVYIVATTLEGCTCYVADGKQKGHKFRCIGSEVRLLSDRVSESEKGFPNPESAHDGKAGADV